MRKSAALLPALLVVVIACRPAPVSTPVPVTATATMAPATVTATATMAPTAERALNTGASLALPAPEGAPSSELPMATIRVGRLARTFAYYIPPQLPPNAPVVLVFHGSGMTGEGMRSATERSFDQLADRKGFLLVYPNGYQNTWNDCRKAVNLPAKIDGVDDVSFVRALIAQLRADYSIDPARVYAMGFSNGAHFVYRLAVEAPDALAAVAAISANFSTDENSDCRPVGKPIPIMILLGTADPLNPYHGGLAYRGATVRSAEATAEYFARLNGQTQPPRTTHLETTPLTVDRLVWDAPGKPEVVLVSINGGVHEVPRFSFLDGPAEIWDFFAAQ